MFFQVTGETICLRNGTVSYKSSLQKSFIPNEIVVASGVETKEWSRIGTWMAWIQPLLSVRREPLRTASSLMWRRKALPACIFCCTLTMFAESDPWYPYSEVCAFGLNLNSLSTCQDLDFKNLFQSTLVTIFRNNYYCLLIFICTQFLQCWFLWLRNCLAHQRDLITNIRWGKGIRVRVLSEVAEHGASHRQSLALAFVHPVTVQQN